MIQVQAFIIAYLHEKMPGVFGNKRKEKEKLINNLASIFQELFQSIAKTRPLGIGQRYLGPNFKLNFSKQT